jgi:hypothetical protein
MKEGDINALKPEMHLNNIITSVPISQKIHCISITETNRLKLHGEMIADA